MQEPENEIENEVEINCLTDSTKYVSPPYLRAQTDPVSEKLCSLVFSTTPDDEQSPITQQFRES
jgi:hypothetical protein